MEFTKLIFCGVLLLSSATPVWAGEEEALAAKNQAQDDLTSADNIYQGLFPEWDSAEDAYNTTKERFESNRPGNWQLIAQWVVVNSKLAEAKTDIDDAKQKLTNARTELGLGFELFNEGDHEMSISEFDNAVSLFGSARGKAGNAALIITTINSVSFPTARIDEANNIMDALSMP